MTTKVRFAPSPTGNLHIGSVRTALFNWLYARHTGGKFVLRIEDTDKERSTKAFEKDILEGLTWLGLNWDEGPTLPTLNTPSASGLQPSASYYQSQRTDIYIKYVDKLLSEGKAYKDKETPAVYFKVPRDGETIIKDVIKGDITFKNSEIKDQVLLKSDGGVVYNFAVVVDDADMGITHVIRGEDHISNTPKQILMYEALGFPLPKFGHLPMILGPDRSKLSKRHGATSVNEYRREGYLPESIINYLALLGWTPEDGKELMTAEELIEKFTLERVSKSNSIFDITKLKWMNGERIKNLSTAELTKICIDFLSDEKKKKITDIAWFSAIIELVKDGLTVYSEINSLTEIFFEESISYTDEDKKVIGTEDAKKVLKFFSETITKNNSFDPESIDADIHGTITSTGLGKGKVLKPIRIATTGRQHGPALKNTLFLLGKEKILTRIASAL